MSICKTIRTYLGFTQAALAEKLGCSQGNVWQYERPDKPQTVPPDTAKKLIELARGQGWELTMDQVYGLVPLPAPPAASTPGAPEPHHETT